MDEDTDLRQALLSPSTTPKIITTTENSDADGANDVESNSSPLPSFPPPESPSSFNVTSFSLTNFLFGGGISSVRRSTEGEDDDDDDQSTITSSSSSCLTKYWSDTLRSNRGLLLAIIVLIVWPLGLHSYRRFTRKTDSSFRVLPGSPSAVAQEAFVSAYDDSSSSSSFINPLHPPLVLVLSAAVYNNNNNNKNETIATLTRNNTAAYAQARNFSLELLPYLNTQHCWTWPNTAGSGCSHADWLRVSSYYELRDSELHWLAASSFAVPDGSSVLLQVEYTLPANETKHHKHRILELMYAIDDYKNQFWKARQNETQYFNVEYTGIEYFSSDLALSTRHDLIRMDVIVLPLALLLMGVVLKSANPVALWIVPVVTVTTTVCIWAIFMRFVASYMQVSTFVPTVMMSLSLGLGIDYTLFLLARYLEEACNNGSRRRAIVRMLSGSGRVLLLSGITLAATFLGLVFLPLSMLKSIGVGAATAILTALVVNLTVVPTLLHTRLGLWIVADDHHTTRQENNIHSSAYNVASGLEYPATNDANEVDTQHESPTAHRRALSGRIGSDTPMASPQGSFWFRLSTQLLHKYRGIVILLVTFQLLLPIAWQATRIKSSISFDLLLPAESPSLQTFHALGEKMGLGRLNPYRILFDGHEANITMTSNIGFGIMFLVLDELRAIDHRADDQDFEVEDAVTHIAYETRDRVIALSKKVFDEADHPVPDPAILKDAECNELTLERKRIKPTIFNGISVLKNIRIPHAIFVSAKYCSQLKPYCPYELLHLLDEVDKLATSGDEYATFLTATLGTSPFSDEGVEWLVEARETIERLENADALSGVKVYIEGSAGVAHDAVQAVYRAFPIMIVVTTIVVFLLMGIFFRSFFHPIRSIVSISLTLSFSFGMAVLVFQDGIFNWTHVRAFTSMGNDVCWLVPIMALSIIIGLALDYDVFLISRILEFRLDNYEHKSSIAAGLNSTGAVITAAGLIMAFAFGSLMFGSNPVLYQWSFLLTTAVLLDTFVIRTIVVPILTGLAGRCCWWPRKLPEDRLCFLEFQKQEEDDVAGLLRTLEASSEYEPLQANGHSEVH